jgi:hypothetical protein
VDEESQDQKQFFKDFGATAEQTGQEVRGFEEYYYSLIQRTMPALPWLADFNKKLQSYVTQNFAAAYEFTRELSQAKNVQDFIRIQTDYIQKCGYSFAAQMQDFTETYCSMASSAIEAASISSSEE